LEILGIFKWDAFMQLGKSVVSGVYMDSGDEGLLGE
jgi:hypothetical protein